MAKIGSNLSINLSAIIYKEDGVWLAHCLELDIVAEGKNVEDACRSLVSLCDLQIKTAVEQDELQSIFRPAPPEFWKLFAIGHKHSVTDKPAVLRKTGFQGPVDRFEAREMTFA
jgi:predicted RNase H-like HicB family nuclease